MSYDAFALPRDLPGYPEPIEAANTAYLDAMEAWRQGEAEAARLSREAQAAVDLDRQALERAVNEGTTKLPKPVAEKKQAEAETASQVVEAQRKRANQLRRELGVARTEHLDEFLRTRRERAREVAGPVRESVPQLVDTLTALRVESELVRVNEWSQTQHHPSRAPVSPESDPRNLGRQVDKASESQRQTANNLGRSPGQVDNELPALIAALGLAIERELAVVEGSLDDQAAPRGRHLDATLR